MLDRWANGTTLLFGSASIALASLGYNFPAAICGLLSEPGFFYVAWRARSWGVGLLSAWWTVWWAVMAVRNF